MFTSRVESTIRTRVRSMGKDWQKNLDRGYARLERLLEIGTAS